MTPSRTSSRSESDDDRGNSALRVRGKVQRVYADRGFGFIKCLEGAPDDVGQDFFFHASGLDDCAIADLEEGLLVTFEPRYVAKGKRAEHIARR